MASLKQDADDARGWSRTCRAVCGGGGSGCARMPGTAAPPARPRPLVTGLSRPEQRARRRMLQLVLAAASVSYSWCWPPLVLLA